MDWVYNDGGRKKAGFKGKTEDCVTRAVAIITKRNYLEVYNELTKYMFSGRFNKIKKGKTARTGIPNRIVKRYMKEKGFNWVSLMGIGTGCKVHLRKEELPPGEIICNCSKHFVAVIDGVINDIHDCSRNGTRCVYGYWKKKQEGLK